MKFNEIISKLIESQYFYVFLAVVILIVVLLLLLIVSKNLRSFFLEIIDKIKSISFSKTKNITFKEKNNPKNSNSATVIKDNEVIVSEIEEIGSNVELTGNTVIGSKIGCIGSKTSGDNDN